MITKKECLKILTKYGNNYSEQDAEEILGFLQNLADIAFKEYTRSHGKSHIVHESLNGRTSREGI